MKKNKKIKLIEKIFLAMLTIQVLVLALLIIILAMPSPTGFFGGFKKAAVGSSEVIVTPEMWGQIIAAPIILIVLTSISYNSFKKQKSKVFWIISSILLLLSLTHQAWIVLTLLVIILFLSTSKGVRQFLKRENNNLETKIQEKE